MKMHGDHQAHDFKANKTRSPEQNKIAPGGSKQRRQQHRGQGHAGVGGAVEDEAVAPAAHVRAVSALSHGQRLSADTTSALEHVTDAYKRFLEGRFRKEFNLVGTPLRIELKTSKNPYADKE